MIDRKLPRLQLNMVRQEMSSHSWTSAWKAKILALALSSVLLVQCSRTSSPSVPHSTSQGEVFRVQLSNEPVSLDPSFAEDGVSLQVLANIWEGLVGYGTDGKLENRLAKSYRIFAQGRKVEFELKKEAKWSDGKPVTVQDFITAFRRTLGPASKSKLAPLFFSIKNAEAFHQHKVPASELGVQEKDGRLLVELERPTPYFIHSLVLPSVFPLRQDILDENQGRWPETAPSTGAYRLVSHRMEREIQLELNPHRLDYGGKPPSISKVQFLLVSDESTALNLFRRGKLDIMTRIPSFEFSRLKAEGLIQTRPFYAVYYLAFNCRKPPFQDREWRRAVAGSIQRKEIVSILGSGETPAWSWIPEGLEGFIPLKDPMDSKPLLEAVEKIRKKYEKQETRPSTSYVAGFDSGARNSRIMEKVQQDLKKQMGLGVSLMHMDWRSYIRTLQTDPPAIFRFGWLAPFNDPVPLLRVFTSHDPNNYTGCESAEYDQLVRKIEGMQPGEARLRKIFEAQKILLEEEAMVVPIYHYVQNIAVSPRVKEFQVSPFGSILFRYLAASSAATIMDTR